MGLLLCLKLESFYQLEKVGWLPAKGWMVSKKSSCWMWYWGEAIQVSRLRIREMEVAWHGNGPRYSPNRALGSHLWCLPPAGSLFCKACKGQPNEWSFLSFGATGTQAICSRGSEPSSLCSKRLQMRLAFLRAYVQRQVSIAAANWFLVWRSCFVACSWRSLILFLAVLF